MLTFLQPLFLWFAAAAVVPLVLHLLQRRRTVRQPFPTLRFLKAAQKRSASRIRFENLLLWLLRTALLLAVVAAFALPVIRASRFGDWLGRAPRDVALILDASYSMAYESEAGTVWRSAREAAEAVVADLVPGDRVCVFLAGDTVQSVVGEPTSELGGVLQTVRALEWQPGTSRLDEALRMAVAALARSGGREREIYLLTDGQALPWQGFRDRAAEGLAAAGAPVVTNAPVWDPAVVGEQTACFALLAGPLMPENAWVDTVGVEPPLLLDGGKAQLTVRLGRTGRAENLPVSVTLDGQEVVRREVAVEADGFLTVDVPVTDLTQGVHAARVATPPDALPVDDAFDLLLRVQRELPVLVVGTAEAARFLLTALRPAGQGPEVKRVAPAELDGTDLRGFDAVFLVDALPLSGQALLGLETYVKAGGVLAVWPGDRAGVSAYAEWTILPARPVGIRDVPGVQAARVLRRVVREDPLFTGFVLPPGTVPTLALKRVLAFDALERDATVLVATDADEPFILARGTGRGRVFLFAASADRQWSTLPLTAFFLPVVHQIVRFGSGLGQPPVARHPGLGVPADDALTAFRADDRLLAPSGRAVSVREVRGADDSWYVIEALDESGIYTRLRAGMTTAEPACAVNFDRAESRLDTLDPEAVVAWTGLQELRVVRDLAALQRAVQEHRRGRPLSEPLLWLALILAGAEWWLANRIQRRRPPLTETLTVEVSGRVSGSVHAGAARGNEAVK